MATTNGSVAKAINNYWRSGIIGGLIIIDAVVLSICVLDSIRFALSGLSYGSALRVTVEEVLEGQSVVLAIAVFAFFLFALPMVMALLFVFRPREHWPELLGGQPQGLLSAHVFLSFVIALFTGAAVTMEVLSGWTRQQGVWRYSFVSLWLSAVFLGKPAYVAFISPIIRKFVVRASADPRATKLKEVAVEVLTEDNIERRAG